MVDYRDILVNISPIIFLILIFTLKSIIKEKKFLLYILSTLLLPVYIFYILKIIIDGYGHIFPVAIFFVIITLFLICNRILFKNDSRIVKILLILANIWSIIFFLLIISFRLAREKIIEYISNIVGFDYIKFFESIIENDWFKGISIGIIGTVFGGLMLDKIKNRK